MRCIGLLFISSLLCVACAGPRYQLPQTQAQLEGSVTTAEQSYQSLYTEYKAGHMTKDSMAHVDVLYNVWRNTQRLLIDSMRAGAIEWAPAE